jgi:hypothetical protein
MNELWYFIVLAGIGTMGAGVFVLLLGFAAAVAIILEDDR